MSTLASLACSRNAIPSGVPDPSKSRYPAGKWLAGCAWHRATAPQPCFQRRGTLFPYGSQAACDCMHHQLVSGLHMCRCSCSLSVRHLLWWHDMTLAKLSGLKMIVLVTGSMKVTALLADLHHKNVSTRMQRGPTTLRSLSTKGSQEIAHGVIAGQQQKQAQHLVAALQRWKYIELAQMMMRCCSGRFTRH